jgi:hypothetical protein
MALEDFLGKRMVQIKEASNHEADGHEVTIRIVVACAQEHTYPEMTYHPKGPDEPERLEGRYSDDHLITITRREDGKGIDCTITKDFVDTGSWTADDHGTGNDGD